MTPGAGQPVLFIGIEFRNGIGFSLLLAPDKSPAELLRQIAMQGKAGLRMDVKVIVGNIFVCVNKIFYLAGSALLKIKAVFMNLLQQQAPGSLGFQPCGNPVGVAEPKPSGCFDQVF